MSSSETDAGEQFPGISLVYPMYYEEENCETAVRRAVSVLERMTEDFEVIVVNDGSTDRTGEIADQLAAEDKRVKVIHHPQNRGYGAALRSGFDAATMPLVFFTDGDNQFDLEDLPAFAGKMGDADVLSGYRIARQDPWHRRLYSFSFNRLARVLFDIPISDVNCAFKLYRREMLQSLDLQSTHALINVETMARARKKGAVIRETGVPHYPRTAGSQTGGNPGVIYRTFVELFRLYRELR